MYVLIGSKSITSRSQYGGVDNPILLTPWKHPTGAKKSHGLFLGK